MICLSEDLPSRRPLMKRSVAPLYDQLNESNKNAYLEPHPLVVYKKLEQRASPDVLARLLTFEEKF